jgi:hypothetical protein
MLMGAVVITVYGVLFLDWNSQGNPDNQPFHGVCWQKCIMKVLMLIFDRSENGSLV